MANRMDISQNSSRSQFVSLDDVITPNENSTFAKGLKLITGTLYITANQTPHASTCMRTQGSSSFLGFSQ